LSEWQDWQDRHGGLAAFAMVAGSTLLSGVLAAYMSLSEAGAGTIYVTEVFGTKLYLTAVGTGVLMTGLIAGEIYIVSKIGRTKTLSEGLVLLSFALLSGMLALIFTQTFAYSYFPVGGAFLVLLVSGAIFVSVYLTFLVVIGEYSERVKNILLLIFGATIGAFFSLLIPLEPLFFMLIVVVSIDVGVTYSKSHGSEVEPTKLSVTTRELGVGMGDIIVFAMVTDKALIATGAPGYFVSIGLLALGFWGAVRLVNSRSGSMVPGTLLAALPASLPIALVLLLG